MPDGERRITHYVGDACAGGHTEQEIAARSEELYSKATKPKQEQEPIDLEVALRAARERVQLIFDPPELEHTAEEYQSMFDAALDQYEALARAVGALHDGGCCPAVDSCFDDVGVCHVHAYRDEAERLAREVLMQSEQERAN